MSNANELIVIEQLPVITERLRMLSDGIRADIDAALALECDEESVKHIKAARARLNNDFNLLEERRKAVKKAVLDPYERFEAAYKEYVSNQYRDADKALSGRVADVEGELKNRKYGEVKAYLIEYAESRNVGFIRERCISNIKVTLSASVKSLKEQAKAFVDRVAADVDMVNALDDRDEIMAEYMTCYDAARAVAAVANRKKAVAEQEARRAEAEAARGAREDSAERARAAASAYAQADPAALAPAAVSGPKSEEPPEFPMWYAFKALMIKAQAKALKMFFKEGGIQYE